MTTFENGLMKHLENDKLTPQEIKFKKWLAARPKGLLRKRAINQLENNAKHAIADSKNKESSTFGAFGSRDIESFSAIDWAKLLEMLWPIIKMILALFL